MKREEMIAVIEGGGSVLHEGKLHTRIETLPSKASLAQSEAEKNAAAGDLDAQIAALQAQRAALKTNDNREGGGSGADDTIEELMKHTRPQLVEKAKESGVEIGEQDTKQQIAEAILAKSAATEE